MRKHVEKQIRCGCGKLYLVKKKNGYEFKCGRCKRICLLSYEMLLNDYSNRKEAGNDG